MSGLYAAPEHDLTNYTYEPESEIEDTDSEENIPLGETQPAVDAASVNIPTPSPQTKAEEPSSIQEKRGKVPGFQMVQAKGMADTSTPAPRGSSIPSFATATPVYDTPLPHQKSKRFSAPPMQPPMPVSQSEFSNPLSEQSKSRQFVERSDYLISEFFSRQVSRLTLGAPEAIQRSYRVFQQKFKESLGSQWAHVTSQPEVEEAIKHVQKMYDYFDALEKMVRIQKNSLQKVNDIESELSIWYKKEGVSEGEGPIRENMLHLSNSYNEVCAERESLILAYEQYATFLATFRDKAIADAIITMKKQYNARVELDAFGSRLGQLEEKKLKTFARAPSPAEGAALEKELGVSRLKFQEAKKYYQQQSTALIDKAGLLSLKKGADFSAHLAKIRQVHDSFNRGRVGLLETVPDEEDVDYEKK